MITITERTEADLAQLDGLAREVRALDGYPVWLPDDDMLRFLAVPASLRAWTARNDGGVLVGHVALNVNSSEAVHEVLRSCGLDDQRVGVVARLFVSPTSRRRGVAQMLLGHAATAAREAGLVPVLDVVSTFSPAIALYERAGWTRLGVATLVRTDGVSIDEVVFALLPG